MFTSVRSIKTAIREVLSEGGDNRLKAEKLREELEELKLRKRMEEAEIKHLVKMKEEKQLIETQKKEIELQRQFQEKEMHLQKEYHEKVLATIDESRKESRDLYTKIMERLPNVNMEIKRNG